jgi:hypothetical protein
MGVRENKVERYLHDRVTALGGTSRKWASPGMRGVPDRIVIVPWGVWLVEVKTSDGKLSSDQVREHQRLTDAGARVRTVYGHQGVDQLIIEVMNAQTTTTV